MKSLFSFWDETEIMKNLSRAARTHQALVCKGSALVCNNRLQQDSIIQKFFLVKFLEMVRSIKIPWVHVMSTNYDKSASDFHQYPIWVRFWVRFWSTLSCVCSAQKSTQKSAQRKKHSKKCSTKHSENAQRKKHAEKCSKKHSEKLYCSMKSSK